MIGLKIKYFVLKPKSKKFNDPYARASRQAMAAYANSIQNTNAALAYDLRQWVIKEIIRTRDLSI